MKKLKKIVKYLLVSIIVFSNMTIVKAVDLFKIKLPTPIYKDDIVKNPESSIIETKSSTKFEPGEEKIVKTEYEYKDNKKITIDTLYVGKNIITKIDTFKSIISKTNVINKDNKVFDFEQEANEYYNKLLEQQKILELEINNKLNGKYIYKIDKVVNDPISNKDYIAFVSKDKDLNEFTNEYISSLSGNNELVIRTQEEVFGELKSISGYEDDKSLAILKQDEIIKKIEQENGKIVNSVIAIEKDNTKNEVVENINKSFEKEEEANNEKDNLNNSSNDEFEINTTVTSKDKFDKTDVIGTKEIFTSLEQAQAYKNNLLNNGYNVDGMSIEENKTTINLSINEIYETKEEAENNKKLFNTVTTDNGTAKITEVRDEKGDTVTNINETYNTSDDAKKALNGYLSKVSKYYQVTANIMPKKTVVYGDKENIDLGYTFAKEKEAQDYKKSLEQEGYKVNDFKVTTVKESYKPALDINYGTSDGRVTNDNRVNVFLRLDGNVQYENGTTGYDDSNYVFVGSVGVLKKGSIFDINANNHNNDLSYLVGNNNTIGTKVFASLSNNTIKTNLAKYGINFNPDTQVLVYYVLKNTEDIGAMWEYKTISGSTISVYRPSCKYHIDAVIRNKSDIKDVTVTRYSVSGTKQTISNKTLYDLKGSIKSLDYDYKVEGNGSKTSLNNTYSIIGEATKDLYKKEYYVTGTKTKLGYKAKYQIDYNELTGYNLTIKSNKLTFGVTLEGTGSYNNENIYDVITTKEEDVFKKATKEDIINEEIPPYTGVKESFNTYIAMLYMAIVAGITIKKHI